MQTHYAQHFDFQVFLGVVSRLSVFTYGINNSRDRFMLYLNSLQLLLSHWRVGVRFLKPRKDLSDATD